MELKYAYPVYQADLSKEKILECIDIAVRLLEDVGILIRHARFRQALEGKDGVKIEGSRVKLKKSLVQKNIEKILEEGKRKLLLRQEIPEEEGQWKASVGGTSMAVLDIETDEIRPATCADLRDLIRLMDSYGLDGNYPVMPQDLPAIMQAIACYKICWESSNNVRPYDYQNIEQTDYIYEMHKVMGKTFPVSLTVTQTMCLSEHDLETFFKFYPAWKKGADIGFSILDYGLLGINKPITATGCITQFLAEEVGVYTLFNLFDPQLEMPISIGVGHPTDLRSVCWAFGHPRIHLFSFLNSRIWPILCGVEVKKYSSGPMVRLETSSCAIDEQAALEKMAVGLTGALQGARNFYYLGSLAVDDLFSGVQLVIDYEMVNYIKESISAFNPHPDLFSMEGIYQLLRDVSLDREQFISHPDTAEKFRNILPSSKLLYREKLRQWLGHRKTLKERARAECLGRLKEHKQAFELPPEKQKALNEIYRSAEAHLTG